MIPKHYSDWVHYYDLILNGKMDFNSVLVILQQGTLDWNPGVAAKMVKETYNIIEYKLKKVTEIFQKELNHANGTEIEIVNAIVNARNGFNNVRALCNLVIFPQDVIIAFNKTVDNYVHSSQQNLYEFAKEDRTGMLTSIFKNNRLITTVLSDVATQINETNQQPSQNIKTGRRVLF